MLERQITPFVEADLREKMVFIAGPRQCGKTTLARDLLARRAGAYYNQDVGAHRQQIRDSQIDESADLWVFDELHKFRRWRNWLKGLFDLHDVRIRSRAAHPILVTGSARLDVYSHGGDSLEGRYHAYRLHPLTLAEVLGIAPAELLDEVPQLARRKRQGAREARESLLELGGFPEPFLSSSARAAARWRLGYGARLVREEIRSLQALRDLDRLELLYDRLAGTIGSVLSINSLREDLEVAFETARSWIAVFERMYAVLRIAPFGPPRIKAVRKEQKLYLWDWARVESRAARFENLVAIHLLRLVHWYEDVAGERLELRYFRTTAGHEVDFVVLRRGKPWIAVELKLAERPLDANLKYLLERVEIPFAFQVSLDGERDWRPPDINGAKVRVLPAERFLVQLP